MAKKYKYTFKNWIEYVSLRTIFGILSILPYERRVQFILRIIQVLASILKSIRRRIFSGLDQAFPDFSKEEKEKIYSDNLKVLARMAVDFEEGPRMHSGFIAEKFIYEPSREEYTKMVQNGGILVLGHLGNWETNGVAITQLLEQNELYVLAKRQSNPWTNAWMEKVRGGQKIKLIYTDESPRIILTLLRKGHLVAFIADQDAGKNGEFIPFLGKLASTFLGPAVFARSTAVPIHFMWSHYNESGQIIFGFQELSRPSWDSKKDPLLWEREFTYTWVRLLEEKVRQFPASYFWLHRRWKRQPQEPEKIWKYWEDWNKK